MKDRTLFNMQMTAEFKECEREIVVHTVAEIPQSAEAFISQPRKYAGGASIKGFDGYFYDSEFTQDFMQRLHESVVEILHFMRVEIESKNKIGNKDNARRAELFNKYHHIGEFIELINPDQYGQFVRIVSGARAGMGCVMVEISREPYFINIDKLKIAGF